MSPVSSVYDHLTFNIHQQPTAMNQRHLPNSKSNFENLHLLAKRKSLPIDEQQAHIKRRFTITNISIPEPIRHTTLNDHVFDMKKSSTTQNISMYQQNNSRYCRIPSSASNMDFRPLIINGRRKFSAIPSSSSMIIIKKKSPPPMNYVPYNQRPLIRSIPVDLLNNSRRIAVSPVIPSSLSYSSSSYSSSSPSTSASSTNVGTIFLPIQVTKSQQNINNNNTIKYRRNTIVLNEGQRGYRYIDPPNSFADLHREKRTQLDDDDDDLDQSTRVPSTSSIGGEGYNYKSTIMMDSNVLRLIRRYDPRSSNTIGIIPRRSLESTRGLWHSASLKADTPQPSDSSPFLSRRSLTATRDDEIPLQQSPTRRLQRQQAIHEEIDSSPSVPPPPPPPPPAPPLRPILKYNTSTRSRSEFIVQPHQTEPLSIHIDPIIPPVTSESAATYQPLITTGTKRVCSALSKSEWDLRVQQEQFPILPPSPSSFVINQQQERESYRPTLSRSKSSITINNTNDQDDHIDDADEISAPILPTGSCVEKLKQLFVTKSSLDLTNPSLNKQPKDSNLLRSINPNNQTDRTIKPTPLEIEPRMITKPTTIIQDVTPIFKKPIFRSQKTIDSPESINRSNNSIQMPSSDISYDAYRFRRLNDQESVPQRPKNIAKVEPYSMNTNAIRPLYQSSQPITEPTVAPSLKARIHLNSMGNTPTNSSTSSSAGSLRHSDFIIPNPAYSKAFPQPTSSSSPPYPTPPTLLQQSFSHGSLHQLPIANIPSYNGHATGLPSSKNNSQDKYQSSIPRDFQPSMHMPPSSFTNHPIPNSSYHYRPLQNIERQQVEMPIRSAAIIEEQQQDNQQPRRRFHRRKQMKRSKSADLYQEPSAFISPTTNQQDLHRSFRPQRSISREHLEGVENLSSSSSSSSLTADIERVNRAALLRYKSLDSIAFKNRKFNPTSNRKMVSKPVEFDFDSDDSVCGIPKPRKTIGR